MTVQKQRLVGTSAAHQGPAADTLVSSRREVDESGLTGRHALVLLGLLVLFGLLLRLLFVQIFFSPDDDVFYLRDAYLLAHGHFVHNTHWALRLGVVAPTAMFIRLFGFHDWSIMLYPLGMALLGILLAYAMAAAFFNRVVGLLAALLLACFPEHIYYSSLVMADLPGAFWGSLAVLLAYYGRNASAVSRSIQLSAMAGLALVMSYLCWELNLLFVPVCCLAAAWDAERRWLTLRISTILFVLFLAFSVECAVYWHLSGDPLLRWTIARQTEARLIATMSPIDFVLRVPRIILIPTRRQYFLYSWLVVWAAFVLRRRLIEPSILFIAVWLAGFLIVLGYGVQGLHPLRPLLDIEYVRYLDDLTFPAILLIARALYATRPKRQQTG